MSRGGARKGAGRKATGSKTILAGFSLSSETLARLDIAIPRGQRSKFVEAAIIKKLGRLR
jgi:hypothetical protein